MTALDIPNLTLLFVATVLGLAMAFVWMFWAVQQSFGQDTLARVLARLGHQADKRNRRD